MRVIQKTGIILVGLGVLYVLFVGILYVMQDFFLYFPRKRTPILLNDMQTMPELKEVSYFLPSGERLYAWYRPAQKGKKTVVYFHGNAYNVEYHSQRKPVKIFYQKGYGLLLPEYRGYGNLKGKPSQESMEKDAETAIKYLNGLDIQNKDILLYGHSMGTYPAVYAAAKWGKEKPFNGVILEAPFFSAESVGYAYLKHLVPVHFLLKNKHPSNAYIRDIHTRLFIAHGKKDGIIPFDQGWQLYNYANEPKTFLRFDTGGHNNLPDFGLMDSVLSWMNGKK